MRLFVVLAGLLLHGCVVHHFEVQPVETTSAPADAPIVIESPVKAHLKNGSTVVFENGARVIDGVVYGEGRIYDLKLAGGTVIQQVPVADIAAMESYQTPVNTAASVGGTLVGGTVVTLGVIGGLLVLFGSCPTVYSFEGGQALLEAETFSYSIAPSFQSRDIDKLGLQSTASSVELELRNEMLETHYVDHLALLEIMHPREAVAVPDHKGRPLIYTTTSQVRSARDQNGLDVTEILTDADDRAWRTTEQRLLDIDADDYHDQLDLQFEVPADGSDVALVLRLRNSLLSTVMLYDVMLSSQGYAALDWIGEDLQKFGKWFQLGSWYQREMGMHILAWDGERYRKVGRVSDLGPIAWNEQAVRIPSGYVKDGELRLRLHFIADNWRIDHAALALDVERAQSRLVAVNRVEDQAGVRQDVPAFLASPDKQYLVSRPGDSLRLQFDVSSPNPGMRRSLFLVSEGYYVEWMRSEWLQSHQVESFRPDNDAVLRALEIWGQVREDYRRKFEQTRVAIR